MSPGWPSYYPWEPLIFSCSGSRNGLPESPESVYFRESRVKAVPILYINRFIVTLAWEGVLSGNKDWDLPLQRDASEWGLNSLYVYQGN